MDGHAQGHQSEEGRTPRRIPLLALCLLCLTTLLVLSVLLSTHRALAAANLIANPGFEDGIGNWQPLLGITFTTSTQHVRSGDWAAALSKSGTTGLIWIFQDVSVVAGATYTLTGWVYQNDPKFDQACLRIRWRGSDWLNTQQWCVASPADYFRPITSEAVIAPVGAITARVMAVADISEANPSIPVYFDDLCFTSSLDPPPTPMGTPFYVPMVVKNYATGP